MSDIYQRQRAALLTIAPAFAGLLPETPPAMPAVATIERAEARRLLREPANNHASLLFVVGWGDGSLLRWIASDPQLIERRVFVLVLKSEEDAFAASFTQPFLDAVQRDTLRMAVVGSIADVCAIVEENFSKHDTITELAGCDVIDSHPLTLRAEAQRRELLPELMQRLSDRPQMYGNDIADTFIGLVNGSKNAPNILPAPTIDELWGYFGQTPVISIAGGPSLARHIDQLRALQNRCILVACDSVMPGLIKAGIEPHFCTPLERLPATVDLVQAARGTRTIFAGSCVVPPGAVEPFAGRTIGVYGGDQLYTWLIDNPGRRVNTGSSTGVFSYMVGNAMTEGPVYLVGHDLARHRDQSHWIGSDYSSTLWKEQKTRIAASARVATGYEDRLVPGNDGGTVPSIVWWDRFRNELGVAAINMFDVTGRPTYNVNAHDRIGAFIPGTQAAPLPNPNSLPELGPLKLPPPKPERLSEWRGRATRLGEDAATFRKYLRGIRSEIGGVRQRPPETWPLADLAQKLSLSAEVSAGNRQAFSYFLRSALYNSSAELHYRRRTPVNTRWRWAALDSMDGLCHALDNALEKLQPELEEISRDCA